MTPRGAVGSLRSQMPRRGSVAEREETPLIPKMYVCAYPVGENSHWSTWHTKEDDGSFDWPPVPFKASLEGTISEESVC